MDHATVGMQTNTVKGIKKTTGVLDPFTLIYNIEKYSKESMIETFNKSVRRLRGLLAGTTYALDSTIIETKSDFPGCGMTKREKEDSKGESSKVIYGFKLFILYEVKSRIIIAMDIVPANESDSKYFLSMVKKGEFSAMCMFFILHRGKTNACLLYTSI